MRTSYLYMVCDVDRFRHCTVSNDTHASVQHVFKFTGAIWTTSFRAFIPSLRRVCLHGKKLNSFREQRTNVLEKKMLHISCIKQFSCKRHRVRCQEVSETIIPYEHFTNIQATLLKPACGSNRKRRIFHFNGIFDPRQFSWNYFHDQDTMRDKKKTEFISFPRWEIVLRK